MLSQGKNEEIYIRIKRVKNVRWGEEEKSFLENAFNNTMTINLLRVLKERRKGRRWIFISLWRNINFLIQYIELCFNS